MLFDKFFFGRVETPPMFGLFHLVFLILFLTLTILLIIFYRKCSNKTFKLIVFTAWIIMFMFEIGKQILKNYDEVNHCFTSYDWSAFPYQFCSLPLYLFPLVCFLPESKYKNALNLFIGTFVFFGGYGFFFFPVALCDRVYINHQTLIHHGLQFSVSLFILVHEKDKFNYRMLLQSVSYLVFSVMLAIILNVCFSNFGTINLFELNPLQKTEALVFSNVLNATNYVVYLLCYLTGFTIFAHMVYFGLRGIEKIVYTIKSKKQEMILDK